MFQYSVLQKLFENVSKYKQSLSMLLDKLISLVLQQIIVIDGFSNQLQQTSTIDDLKRSFNDKNEEIYKVINQQLQNVQTTTNTDDLFSLLQQIDKNKKQQTPILQQVENKPEQQQQNVQVDKPKQIQFQYKLMEKMSKKQNETCTAFSMSEDSKLLFHVFKERAKANQLSSGYIVNEIKMLLGDCSDILCLHYMTNSGILISGSLSGGIRLFGKNKEGQWDIRSSFQRHKDAVYCVLANQKEDLIISCGKDNTVRFWALIKEEWTLKQTITMPSPIYALNLNEQSNRFIVCVQDPIISVGEYVQNEWQITQTIVVEQNGFRLCFIDSNQFAFQPVDSEYLEFYQFDEVSKEFFKSYDTKVQSSEGDSMFFPAQYIKQKEILIVKNNKFVNVLRKQEDGKFSLQQSIEFQTANCYGRATQDGQYLLTWDDKSREIKSRKLEYGK